jgi:hypothetical protein
MRHFVEKRKFFPIIKVFLLYLKFYLQKEKVTNIYVVENEIFCNFCIYTFDMMLIVIELQSKNQCFTRNYKPVRLLFKHWFQKVLN